MVTGRFCHCIMNPLITKTTLQTWVVNKARTSSLGSTMGTLKGANQCLIQQAFIEHSPCKCTILGSIQK